MLPTISWDGCVDPVTGVATLACIPIVIKNVIIAALFFAGVISIVLIIYAGIKFISSRGDPTQVDAAKKTLTYAIIGLIIIFLSFFIVNVISNLTGVEQIANPTL